MKKLGVVLLIFLLSFVIVFAQDETTPTVDEKAGICLEGKVATKCATLSLKDQVFSLLALSYNSSIQTECRDSILNLSFNNTCWPKPENSCNIISTSQAIIALNSIGRDTSLAEEWILSFNKTSPDLNWYLEIDSEAASTCNIGYDTGTDTVSLAADKKITSPGSLGCFQIVDLLDNPTPEGYWLRMNSNCLEKEFNISCTTGFLSTLLYRKPASTENIWYVSSQTKSADEAPSYTTHKVDFYCFTKGTTCDYEENLWASLALEKANNNNYNKVLPFLIVFADEDSFEGLFPSAFLHILTDNYLGDILTLQETAGNWDVNSGVGKGRYFDTALALLSLPESQAEINARIWLEDNQEGDGCWNNGNIKDTAFLLWAGWGLLPTPPPGGGTNGGGTTLDYCDDYDYYCMTQAECNNTDGNTLDNYICSGADICCDREEEVRNCEDEQGAVCTLGKECDGFELPVGGQDCCFGYCVTEGTVVTPEPECEIREYDCRTSCFDDEQEDTSYDCPSSRPKCCTPKGAITPGDDDDEEGSMLWLWILLIVLIVLVALGIIFRNRLQVALFKAKGGYKKGPVTKTRPPFPPYSPRGGVRRILQPRPGPASYRRAGRPVMPRAKTKTERELEETMKKLKEISKSK